MKHAQVMLFLGKGGVGKTTCSVATAVQLAERGRKVLLVSLDPAHNTADVLQQPLCAEKTSVTSKLDALEIDLEQLVDRYLSKTSASMRHTYRHLTVMNLEKMFEIIRYSPGIEEHATLEALKGILSREAEGYDAIIFDTAPTGLTLRVLALPSISRIWLDKLSHLRKSILGLRSSIAHIHGVQSMALEGLEEPVATDEENDGTIQELYHYRQETEHTLSVLTNPNLTSVIVVLNPEEMPFLETQRAAATLKKFQIPLKAVLINKVMQFQQIPPEFEARIKTQTAMLERIQNSFPDYAILQADWRQTEPRGLEELRHFHTGAVEFFQDYL
ncbi:anion transporter [candidate division KSB3 bacterium]|uniref:Anion transporter n=1 Tax=candidate division KSB3 bacterium TaxID=2044937 RepID=A0A2G6E6I3_9BACT|nr:MAG: anion transporter [candidate division KSB3 bacterium]PIE30030.1 MAG: anion transporter [candidate division KSB3 bacterium]